MAKVQVYGADWCEDTQRSRQLLDRLGVTYEYTNVDHDKDASAWVKAQNNGKEKKPTIKVGQTIVSEPPDAELERILREQGILS